MNLPDIEFFVPPSVYEFFSKDRTRAITAAWNQGFKQWQIDYPDLYLQFEQMQSDWLPQTLEKQLQELSIPDPISGRKASGLVLNHLGSILPGLYGGSADLARSDMTHMYDFAVVSPSHLEGRNIKYGVREFGMGAIAIGLSLTGMIRPFVGTFLAFSDYMMNAIRMAALMKPPIIYQFPAPSAIWVISRRAILFPSRARVSSPKASGTCSAAAAPSTSNPA